MLKEILECIDEWLTLIDDYKFIDKIAEIVEKITQLRTALNNRNVNKTESVIKTVYENTDFEGIEIKQRYVRGLSKFITVPRNARYLIDRLSLLAFKKIIEHEFEQSLEQFGVGTRVVYKELKLALDKKGKR